MRSETPREIRPGLSGSVQRTANGNKKEAESLLAQRLIEIGKGNYIAPKDRNITFKEFAEQWLNTRDGKIRPITLSQYNDHLTRHLLPFFGPVRINQIDVSLIDAYSAKKQKEAAELECTAAELEEQAASITANATAEGREMSQAEKIQHSRLCAESRATARKAIGITTINKTITTLGTVLKHAVRSKIIDGNPVRDVERPKETSKAQSDTDESDEMEIPTPAQIRALLDASDDRHRTLLQTAILTRHEIRGVSSSSVGRYRLAQWANPSAPRAYTDQAKRLAVL